MSTDLTDPPVPELPEVPLEEALYFHYPGSDIVLRSCDSHNFHALKLYIANSSPVLRELMRTVSNTSDVANGEEPEPLPVLELPESGATLHSLLTLIFPVVPVVPSTSDQIMELLAVAQKYQMDSVLSHIRCIIGARKDPPFIRPETAFHIYFRSQKCGLYQEALQAARVTLRLPMVIEELGDKLDFSYMAGAYLRELWKYHERVQSDLRSGVLEFRNHGLPDDVKSLHCQSNKPYPLEDGTPCASFPLWLDNYLTSIAHAPHLFDLISFENAWACHIQEKSSAPCSCVGISSQVMRSFWEALTAFVHETIGRADSTLALVNEEPASENSDLPSVPLCLNISDANVILRSSDQVNFHVHKSILATLSPFFEDLLSLPQPTDDELVDGLPVVQLSEDASLLSNLVSLLYRPQRPVQPSSYEKVFALLAACQKYDMVSIQQEIRDKVDFGRFPTPDKAQAFSAYAIASSMGLIPEMENAARLTLGQPMTFKSLGEGLRSFKGQALRELVRYRAANSNCSE